MILIMQNRSNNPVQCIMDSNKPFIYFHTYEITQSVLDTTIGAGKSIEIDLAADDDGSVYIGHPRSFYAFKHLPPPANLPLDAVLDALEPTTVFVVLDCKDVRVLPMAQKIIERFGVERVLVYAWTDALCFKPYPASVAVEPHWVYEDIPLEALRRLYDATHIPMVLGCRGLTHDKFQTEWTTIRDRILDVAAQTQCVGVHFNLLSYELPSASYIGELAEHGIVPWINTDTVKPAARPLLYIGATDNPYDASVLYAE
jgi:hypothetical protein